MHDQMKELTGRCIILAILLTMLLAASNAYLALKLGLLTSASIPAAIISMGVLRFFKGATILENNARSLHLYCWVAKTRLVFLLVMARFHKLW